MRLKPFSLLLCLLTLSCPALAMGKSVYGLNEYIYIEELDLQVAAKLDTRRQDRFAQRARHQALQARWRDLGAFRAGHRRRP